MIINYDDYRYGGFSGFEKYYYQDTNLVKKESYNNDSVLVETVLYKRSANILLTIRKGYKGEIQQINRETFDSKGQSIKLELNFSPKNENDLSFTKIFTYSYYPDGLKKSEDTIRYEYVYDSKKRWIFKTIYAGNTAVSSMFRDLE